MKAELSGATAVQSSAGAFVVQRLLSLDAELSAAEQRVLHAVEDDATHALRVSLRRLCTFLKLARPLFGRWHADVVRRAFADVMRATSALRDEQVLAFTLQDLSARPQFEAWMRRRAGRLKSLRRHVVAVIRHGSLESARRLLGALLAFPVDPRRDVAASTFARRSVRRARCRVDRMRHAGSADAKGLHELRIRYKELRYAIELLSEVLPRETTSMRERASVFQRRLGEIHDIDVAYNVLKAAKTLPESVRREALHRLADRRDKKLAKYLRERDRPKS